jgi:hypothetical protein
MERCRRRCNGTCGPADAEDFGPAQIPRGKRERVCIRKISRVEGDFQRRAAHTAAPGRKCISWHRRRDVRRRCGHLSSLRPECRRSRCPGDRQELRLAHEGKRAPGRARGKRGGHSRQRGDHRKSKLHDDSAHHGARATAQTVWFASGGRLQLPGRFRSGPGAVGRAGGADGSHRTSWPTTSSQAAGSRMPTATTRRR